MVNIPATSRFDVGFHRPGCQNRPVPVIEAPARAPAPGPRARSAAPGDDTRGWYWTTIERALAPAGPVRPIPDLRRLHAAALAAFGVQFVVLLTVSSVVHHRSTVGIDFGIFAQAATQIGRGDLLPRSTLSNVDYLSSHFELVMWPLAVLVRLTGTAWTLLVVQAAALATAGAVCVTWVVDLVRSEPLRRGWPAAITLGTAFVLLVNPLAYGTAAQDFHTWPLAALAVVLAARDVWGGRHGRAWIWAVGALACGDVGGVYLFGVGLSAVLAGRSTRRTGVLLLVAGLAWVLGVSAAGHNQASHVDRGYAYLADVPTLPDGAAGFLAMAGGTLSDPATPAGVVADRSETLVGHLATGGLVGVATPCGIGVPAVTLAANVLQADPLFVGQPFQNVVVTPFVAFGSAWLVVRLAAARRSRTARRLAAIVGIVAVGAASLGALAELPRTTERNGVGGLVGAAQASALLEALDRTPDDAQVLSTVPTIGRFSEREHIWGLTAPPTGSTRSIPIATDRVVVVLDRIHAPQLFSPAHQEALEADLRSIGTSEVIVDRDDVTAYLWDPPESLRELVLRNP